MVVYIIFPWKLHLVALSLSPLIPLFLLRVVSAASCSASLPQLLKYPSKIFYTNYVCVCVCVCVCIHITTYPSVRHECFSL